MSEGPSPPRVRRFHEQTLRRLCLPYVADDTAMAALEERARVLGIALPASFVEWYCMRDGVELLKRYSNCDEPIAIEALGDSFEWRWEDDEDHTCLSEGLLPGALGVRALPSE